MPTPGSEIEIELDTSLVRTTKSDNQDGGEGASTDGGAITDTDILDLKKELEAAKAERDAAKRDVGAANTRVAQTEQQARETNARLAGEVSSRVEEQSATIESGIVSAQGEIDGLRDAVAAALEGGKWADAARLQEEMSDAKLRMRELVYQKGEVARYKDQIKNAPKTPVPQAPGVGAKTQSWINAHPRFNTDSVYRAKALLAHEECLEANIPVESEEYFKKVELMTGDRKADAPVVPKTSASDEGDAPDGGVAIRSGGVAPVTRRAANGGNGDSGRKTIKLTGDQVEAADAMFGEPGTAMYIKDPKERYTYWHTQSERLKSEGRL